MRVVLCVKKEKPYLYGMYSGFESRYGYHLTSDKRVYDQHNVLNGKIVAECDFEVEEIKKKCVDVFKYCYITDTLNEFELMNKTQLNGNTTNNYLKGKNGYAIHIKNLHIFDKPREIDEGFSQVNNCCFEKEVDKDWEGLPIYACVFTNGCRYQSDGHTCDKHFYPLKHIHNMSKVFDDRDCNRKYIISITPQEACNILNYKQDVLIRRNVLKEMK